MSIVNPVDKDQPGTYNTTYNVTDDEGNAADEVVRKVVVGYPMPVLTLNGEAEVTHEVNTDYADLGATVADSFDNDIDIVVANPVEKSKLGDYTVTYNASDDAGNAAIELSRKVIVVDSTAPIIVLTGDAEVNHEGGTEYTDSGATLSDNFDSDVELVVVNPVDSGEPGEYTITYNATDANGNKAAEVTRKSPLWSPSADHYPFG